MGEISVFKELEKSISEKKNEIKTKTKEYKETLESMNAELKTLEDELKMRYEGIQPDYIKIAREVLYVDGIEHLGEGETRSCVSDAVQDILDGFKKLKREYFGAKNYDRWVGQRSDHEYGYGPRHGSIIFKIGLTTEYRNAVEQITEEQINACLYYLRNLDKLANLN